MRNYNPNAPRTNREPTIVQQIVEVTSKITPLAKTKGAPDFRRRSGTNLATELAEARSYLAKLQTMPALKPMPAVVSRPAPAPATPTATELWAQYAKLKVQDKRAFYVAHQKVMDA